MKLLRVYADTSVYGGCFDEEFEAESRTFFRQVADGRFVLMTSFVILRELDHTPEEVQRVLSELLSDLVEVIPDSKEVRQLRDAYLNAGVLAPASSADAEHIVAALAGGVPVL